ncbi:MAG: hypothetical protein WA001_02620 [Patescibacteria group bacterium]
MADGGAGNSQRNSGRTNLSSALSLNSGQQQDRRRASTDDDSRLSDQSIGSAADSRESVLTPGAAAQSYTSGQTEEVGEPIAGGGLMGSSGLELDRMRQQTEQMQRTQAQFLGEAGGAPGATGGGQGARQRPQDIAGQDTESEEEEEEPSEEEMAQQIQQQQQQSLRQNVQNRAKDEIKKRTQKQVEQQAERLVKQGVQQGTRFTLEGAELATSEVLIPLLIMFIQMNIQLVMKYIFRPMFAGVSEDADNALRGAPFFDQSLAEDVAIIAVDGLMCCSAPCTNPACAPFTFLIIMIIVIAKLFGK